MIGSTVGHYRITEKLGDGGLGPVYKAIDTSAGTTVVLRMFAPEIARDPALMNRIQQLIPILQRLQHPNVGAVHGMVTAGTEMGMLVEHVPGATAEHLRRRTGKLAVNVAVSCAVQVLRGLEHAHGLGLFHHAIRPANIVVTQRGTVRVTDFGIGHAFGANRKTREDRLLTVMAYLAPEQLRNQAGDGRSDLYALGVVLYELVTGRLPFDHQTEFALMQGHLNEPPVAPRQLVPDVPDWVDGAIVRALAKQPESRFQHATEMRAVLEGGLGLSTSGSAAIVRGAGGAETVAMFTEAPPIPAVATGGETAAMPGLDTAGPLGPVPGRAESPPPTPPVRIPSRPSFADDETIVLPTPGAPPPDATVAMSADAAPVSASGGRPEVPPASAIAGPEITRGMEPVVQVAPPTVKPAAAVPPTPAAASPHGKAAAAGKVAVKPAATSTTLALVAAAILVVLVAGTAGVWWMIRPSPPATAPEAGGVGMPGEPAPGMPPAEGQAGEAGASPQAAESPADVPPPVSTVPPPPEPEPAAAPPPKPVARPQPKRPAAKPVVVTPPVDTRPQAVVPEPSPPPATVSLPPRITPPRPKLPDLSFQKVKLVTEEDGKDRETDVQLMFLAERMAIAPARGGAIFRSVPYGDAQGAGYTKAEKRRLFIKSSQHLFTVETAEGPLLLRLDNDNVEAILQAFEARTGKTIVREE